MLYESLPKLIYFIAVIFISLNLYLYIYFVYASHVIIIHHVTLFCISTLLENE